MGVTRRRDLLRAGLLAAAAAIPWRTRAASTPRVVVAGGGFAGAGCALALRRLAPGIDVTVVDPHPRYVTCPMSNAVPVSSANAEAVAASVLILRLNMGVRLLMWSVLSTQPNRTRRETARITGAGN